VLHVAANGSKQNQRVANCYKSLRATRTQHGASGFVLSRSIVALVAFVFGKRDRGRDWPNVTVGEPGKLGQEVRIDAFESHQRGDNYGVATFTILNETDKPLNFIELTCWLDNARTRGTNTFWQALLNLPCSAADTAEPQSRRSTAVGRSLASRLQAAPFVRVVALSERQ
jgi:hypothetical protein